MKLSDKISNKLKLPGDNQQFTSTKNNGISIKKKKNNMRKALL